MTVPEGELDEIEAFRSGVLVSDTVEAKHGRVMIGANKRVCGQNCLPRFAKLIVVSNRPGGKRWST